MNIVYLVLGFVLMAIAGVFMLAAVTAVAFAYVAVFNFIYKKIFKSDLIKFL